jgi:hypothetical protein
MISASTPPPSFGIGMYGNPFDQDLPPAMSQSQPSASRKRKGDGDVDRSAKRKVDRSPASESDIQRPAAPTSALNPSASRKRKGEGDDDGRSVRQRVHSTPIEAASQGVLGKRKQRESDTAELDRSRQEAWRDFGHERVTVVATEPTPSAFSPSLQCQPVSFSELNRRFELDKRRREAWLHFDPARTRASNAQAMSLDFDSGPSTSRSFSTKIAQPKVETLDLDVRKIELDEARREFWNRFNPSARSTPFVAGTGSVQESHLQDMTLDIDTSS